MDCLGTGEISPSTSICKGCKDLKTCIKEYIKNYVDKAESKDLIGILVLAKTQKSLRKLTHDEK